MTLNRLVVGLGTFGASSLVWGQEPPPDITWGPLAQAVPLSPVLTTLIAIMLLGAAYAFLKRHSGAGFGVLVMASLLGMATVNEDIIAAIPTYTITTPSGRASPCPTPTGVQVSNPSISPLVGTSVNPGVRILSANQPDRVLTKGREDAKLNVNGHPVCTAGLELYKDSYCYLLCNNPG